MRSRVRAALLAVVMAAAAVGCNGRGGFLTRLYEYEEDLTLSLDGSATLVVNAWAFVVEYRNVAINAGIIDDVMREVDRIRAERGLPTNEEALREQESA